MINNKVEVKIRNAYEKNELKSLISNTRSIARLQMIQKYLEDKIKMQKDLYTDKKEKWAIDISKNMPRYCNEHIEQLREEACKDLLIEIGVPYNPCTDEFYGI